MGLSTRSFSKAPSAPSRVSSASTWRAVSMNRFDCAGSSGFGFGLRGTTQIQPKPCAMRPARPSVAVIITAKINLKSVVRMAVMSLRMPLMSPLMSRISCWTCSIEASSLATLGSIPPELPPPESDFKRIESHTRSFRRYTANWWRI